MATGSVIALAPILATLLIITASVMCIFGRRRLGVRLLFLGIAIAVGAPFLASSGAQAAYWWEGLPTNIQLAAIYLGYAIGFLLVMNLLRHFLALFVGRDAANSAVGNLLASAIGGLFTVIFLPYRILRRLVSGSRSPWNDS